MLGLAPPQQYRREVQVLHKKEGGEKMPKKALHMRLKTGPYSISCVMFRCLPATPPPQPFSSKNCITILL